MKTKAAFLLLFGLASTAAAQDGGLLDWKGKGSETPLACLAEAGRQGRISMLMFTSKGCPACVELSDGPFRDPKVVEASRQVVCIFVDCDWGKKNTELYKRFAIRFYPTVIFCDAAGKVIDTLEVRDPEGVAKRINMIAERHGPRPFAVEKPAFTTDTVRALAEARRTSKPAAFYFFDESPSSLSVDQSLLDPSMKETLARFVFAKVEFRKDSPECIRYGVASAPAILVLDPSAAKPEEKPVARIGGSRSTRELIRDLEAALKAGDGASAPSEPLWTVRLRNGHELIATSVEDAGDKYVLKLQNGGSLSVRKDNVDAVEKSR